MEIPQIIRRNLIMALVIIMIVGCVSHFFIFRFFIHYSTDEILYEYKERVEKYVALHDTLVKPSGSVIKPPRIEERPISNIEDYPKVAFKDTLLYSEHTGDFIPYRQMYFPITYGGNSYLMNVNQPTMETDDLLYAVVTSLMVLFILFLLFTYLISYSLRKDIWKPLNHNLQKLRNYDIRGNSVLELEEAKIQEFDELNQVIMRMVDKINKDYENSRIFSEDASHEMQTPLSVIKSRIDLMMQEEDFKNEEQLKNIMAISRAVKRLSRLNKALLLLTRINNDQYGEKANIEIGNLVKNYLEDMSELIASEKISVEPEIQECICYINPLLAEILISNLLSNAIRHNVRNGKINIYLADKKLVIINDCEENDGSVNYFSRLVTKGKNNDSCGLGLNIVKSICDKTGYEVKYDFPMPDVFRIEVHF